LDQRRPPAGFWTRAEIERSAHQPPTNTKSFDKRTRHNLKSGPGGQLKFLSVNRVSRLKKGQVPTTKIEQVYWKIREVTTLLTPLAESQPDTLKETVLEVPVSQVEVQKAGSTTAIPATVAKPKTAAAVSVLSILKSNEFREAYHQALNLADNTPEAQQATARKIIEGYFRLEEIAPNTPLNSDSFYFTEKPIEVAGNYKFLVPGTIKRELIAGTLSLLSPKAASVERSVEAREFDGAVSAVEAVRLTLVPERVNGIVAFISDAKKFYANNDTAGAEKAIGTALDHLNRAAAEGLGRIKTEAEKGKRSNEVAGTRRTLTNLRRKLQTEITGSAEASRSG